MLNKVSVSRAFLAPLPRERGDEGAHRAAPCALLRRLGWGILGAFCSCICGVTLRNHFGGEGGGCAQMGTSAGKSSEELMRAWRWPRRLWYPGFARATCRLRFVLCHCTGAGWGGAGRGLLLDSGVGVRFARAGPAPSQVRVICRSPSAWSLYLLSAGSGPAGGRGPVAFR